MFPLPFCFRDTIRNVVDDLCLLTEIASDSFQRRDEGPDVDVLLECLRFGDIATLCRKGRSDPSQIIAAIHEASKGHGCPQSMLNELNTTEINLQKVTPAFILF